MDIKAELERLHQWAEFSARQTRCPYCMEMVKAFEELDRRLPPDAVVVRDVGERLAAAREGRDG